MLSWKFFGSWLGSTVTGTAAGLGTTAVFTLLTEKLSDHTPEGKIAIVCAAAIIGSIAGSTSQLITSVSREDQKKWSAASLFRLLATPGVAAIFAIGGALLTDLIFCKTQQNPNISQCFNTFKPLDNHNPLQTYTAGAVATLLGMIGAFAVKKTADFCSKNQGYEYEPLLSSDDGFSYSAHNKCC